MTLDRIDAHQHYWRPARGDYGWLRPDDPALAPLWRDFLPPDLAPLRAAHGIAQTVLVQAAPSEAETDFLLALAATDASIGGVVGWVDLSRAGSVATLERWAAQPKFKGVRPMLQDLPDAHWIAHAPHPDVVRALLRLGLRLDALVQPWHLPGLLRFLDAWPALPVVIDHAAKPQLAAGWDADWAPVWRQRLAEIAARPGVVCKWSGLLTEMSGEMTGKTGGAARAGGPAALAALAGLRPVWDTLLAHFGPARLMWGSDWPVLTLAGDHAAWIGLTEALAGPLGADEQASLWHGCAARFYGLGATAG